VEDIERIWPTPATEAESRRRFPAEWARYQLAAGRAAGRRVLDCACGAGYGSWLLGRTAVRVVGVDVDPAAVEWANEHFASASVAFRRGDGARLPLEDAEVDLAVSFETIEHVHDARGFIAELARVLAPQGELVLSTPLSYGQARLRPSNPFHVREYDDEELARLLAPRFEILERLGQHSGAARRFAAMKRAPGLGALLRSGAHRLLPECLRAWARARLAPPGDRPWISADRWREAPVQIVIARLRP